MADIKNSTLNFGYGRPPCGLNLAGAKLACAKLACAEVQRGSLPSKMVVYG